MSFVSLAFASLFALVFSWRLLVGRNGNEVAYLGGLLAASLVFYAWHVPAYLALLLLSTIVDFEVGRRLPEATNRKRLVVASVCTNLGLLAFFKYTNFFVTLAGGDPLLALVLPMGISFYTFQSMSYTIDIYRGTLTPCASFWRFLLFVGFFPQLVAGPIVRAQDFLYQIARRRRLNAKVASAGAHLIIRGLFLKVVLADNIAPYVDQYWAGGATGAIAPLGLALLFAGQIFADFAGYSSIARGLALMLGFRLPRNFDSPYIAGSFSNFWARWHITLSQWLRDYLYVSLGGNRVGKVRTYVNLMLVMLLGGLWHGAAMTFVVWGALHGTALALERLLGLNRVKGAAALPWWLVVQAVVLVTWIFFRATDVGQGVAFLQNLGALDFGPLLPAFVFLVPLIGMHLRTWAVERGLVRDVSPLEKGLWAGAMLYALLTWYGRGSAFIYFQF